LQGLVDQVAQHLAAQDLQFLFRHTAAISKNDQSQPLVNIGGGDDVTVDDRGRLANRRIGRAEHLDIVAGRQVQIAGRAVALRNRASPANTPPSTSAALLKVPSFIIPPTKADL
jgi:hypothetical protein